MIISFDDLRKLKNTDIFNMEKITTDKFSGVSIDSRKSRPDDLFIAIEGNNFDGHNYVKDIFNKGLKAAIVNKDWYYSFRNKSFLKDKAVIAVKDTVTAMGDLANIYRRKFLIPFIAVAGSNGKTTTKDFIADVLSHKYKVLKSEKSFNNQIGVPLTLFRLNKHHDICVLELGTNHFGEIADLCKIAEPQFGLITNIGKEHLQFFKNVHGVFKAENELTEYLRKCYGLLFLNNDDINLTSKLNRISLNIFSYGRKNSDVNGKIIRYENYYPVTQIQYEDLSLNVRLNIIGSQGFNSALSASAVGFYFRIPKVNILNSLRHFSIKTHSRFELIGAGNYYIIDDTYNSNPDSVKEALINVKKFKIKGEKHLVLADMNELGNASSREHFNIGKLIGEYGFENLYTYGEKAYEVFRGAKRVKNNFYFDNKKTLIDFLKLRIKRNDLVLIKGSRNMKMEEVVKLLKRFNT